MNFLKNYNFSKKITFILLVIAPYFSVLKILDTGFLMQDILGLIVVVLNLKVLIKKNCAFSNMILFFLVSSIVSMLFLGFEPIRFVWAFFFAFVLSKIDFILLRMSIKYSILIASIYLLLTLLCLYIFKINISLDFGKYGLMENTFAGVEEFEISSDLKLGGLFREPNWFSIFAAVGLSTLVNKRNYKYFFIVLTAIILSNSAYGFLIAILSFLFFFKRKSTKLLISVILFLIFVFLFRDSSFFSRSIDTLNFNNPIELRGSSAIRIIEPWTTYYNNISLLPKSYKDNIFPNTGIVILSVFGSFIGLLFYVMLGSYSRFSFLFIAFFLATISDGFYGRIEFSIILALFVGFSNVRALPTNKVLNRFAYHQSIE